MTDFFKFETVKEDIPFYNGKPEVSTLGWAAMILGVILYIVVLRGSKYLLFNGLFFVDPAITSIVSTLVVLIPILYVCKKNYSLFFKKINIKYIIIFTIASIILSWILLALSLGTGIMTLDQSAIQDQQMNILDTVLLIISLVGEEFFKVTLIILFMSLFYRFFKNRKLVLTIGCAITLLIFGAIHEGGSMGSLLKVIIVQGFGSIFDVILYLKTKNVLNSYISHLIFDLYPEAIKLIIYFAGAVS